ncbi:MAG: hypothetical protein RIC87_07940 [Kiloniellales bacterium]
MDEIDTAPPTGGTESAAPPDPREGAAPPAAEAAKPEHPPNESEAPKEEGEQAGEETALPDYRFPDDFAVDQGQLSAFQKVADEHKVSKEAAQAFLDLFVDNQTGQGKAFRDHQIQTIQDWEKQTKADELVGGQDFERKLAVARTAVDRFGDQGLRDYLDESGAGSNPHVVRWMYRAGQFAADDRYIQPGQGTGPLSPEARARRLYDNTYKD